MIWNNRRSLNREAGNLFNPLASQRILTWKLKLLIWFWITRNLDRSTSAMHPSGFNEVFVLFVRGEEGVCKEQKGASREDEQRQCGKGK